MNSSRKQCLAKRRGPASAGMTLVEIMVVVAVSTVVLGMIVSLVIALKQADRSVRRHGVRSARLVELAERLRSDIRQATDVSLAAGNVLVVTTAGGELRQYELGPEGCRRRVVSPGDAPPPGDLFAIGPADGWTIKEGPAGRHPLFMVSLKRPSPDETQKAAPRTPLLVYAARGADLLVAFAPASDN